MILNLETSTKNCSVSIANQGETLVCLELASQDYTHAEKLHDFVAEAIAKAGITFSDIQAVAVSKGPGSYTGLRIGVSAAKGYCSALQIPLISVETLAVLCNAAPKNKGFFIPMLDARRMEVYTSVFDESGTCIVPTQALVLDEHSFANLNDACYVFGDATSKAKTVLTDSKFIFFEDIVYPSAKEMSAMSWKKFQNKQWEDVAYFEPYYLKEFMIGGKK
jgi:tRNA threonylcarbamoyladenosine biosynthesis protein TsaB